MARRIVRSVFEALCGKSVSLPSRTALGFSYEFVQREQKRHTAQGIGGLPVLDQIDARPIDDHCSAREIMSASSESPDELASALRAQVLTELA